MPKFLNQMINEYDEGESIITPRNARFAALAICILCIAGGILFGDFIKTAKGVFLGGAVASFPPARADYRKKHKKRKPPGHDGFKLYGAPSHQRTDGFYSHSEP